MVKAVLSRKEVHHEQRIREAQERVLAASALLEVRVIAAREAGVAWSLIARGIGIARQSAQERFEKLPELEPDQDLV